MARSKTRKISRNPQLKLARLQLDASEVAGRRLLSLGGKSPVEIHSAWTAWSWEKFLAAQRVGWEASWALWSSALAPWSTKAGHRVFNASLRPVERKVQQNRRRLRAGR